MPRQRHQTSRAHARPIRRCNAHYFRIWPKSADNPYRFSLIHNLLRPCVNFRFQDSQLAEAHAVRLHRRAYVIVDTGADGQKRGGPTIDTAPSYCSTPPFVPWARRRRAGALALPSPPRIGWPPGGRGSILSPHPCAARRRAGPNTNTKHDMRMPSQPRYEDFVPRFMQALFGPGDRVVLARPGTRASARTRRGKRLSGPDKTMLSTHIIQREMK